MTIHGPPDWAHEYVEVGGDLRPLLPTPYLRSVMSMGFREVLEQWHEAKCDLAGVMHTRGKWLPVKRAFD